ncbi:Hypothetical predicted protein [Olea europaea subsp. europaea]|uniref:Uncharacterized protein n=1 Tax=Olea europaea subsp. europaea TaxID=158383 RepID=A0A8S0UQE8_OLEEU|nr:Hypothetical predicted protein [Olea europaea subsp. europaea]
MDEEARQSAEPQKEVLAVNIKSLTIKVASAGKEILADNVPSTPNSLSKNSFTNFLASSPFKSPLVVPPPPPPPPSAFVSALQSPRISPRAILDTDPNPTLESPTPETTFAQLSPPASYCGSQSDDIPSTSYNAPLERGD